jgi:hypothetical protein
MLTRITLLKGVLFLTRKLITAFLRPLNDLKQSVRLTIERINSQQVVFFPRGANIANLNRVMLYVQRNEHTNKIKMVHVLDDGKPIPAKLKRDIELLDEAYPEIDVELVDIEGTFSPALIRKLSREWGIPANFMFIGCPGDGMPHTLGELGGVRVIV